MRIFVVLAFSFALLSCIGCSKSTAPSCTDDPVKKLVLDIANGEIRNQLFEAGKIEYDIRDGRGVLPGTYDDFKKHMDAPDQGKVRELISDIDQKVRALNMSLANIRLNGKHDDIKKCECGGNLVLSNGKTLPINYTAQFTEDGKVYVEVAGLK